MSSAKASRKIKKKANTHTQTHRYSVNKDLFKIHDRAVSLFIGKMAMVNETGNPRLWCSDLSGFSFNYLMYVAAPNSLVMLLSLMTCKINSAING